MTTTTNGKRKHGKASDFIQTQEPSQVAQSQEELEQLLTDNGSSSNEAATASVEPLEHQTATQQTDTTAEPSQDLPDPTAATLSAEELLRQAKQQTKKDAANAENVQAEENGGSDTAIAPKTATSEIGAALTQAALSLVEANKEAKQKRIETGILEGIEDAKDIRIGKQLGTLLSLAEADKLDVEELSQQMQNLRIHTDVETADVVTEALKGFGIDLNAIREGNEDPAETGKKKAPLESILSNNLPSKSSSFKIL